ncbi:MAG: hypothetical protein RL173_2702 [Fibrobacterota bacterium]|jgi:SAM-dependent methyltransferase
MSTTTNDELRGAVRERYTEVALADGGGCGCSTSGCCAGGGDARAISSALGYSDEELAAAGEGANLELGCGNPQAIAALAEGEIVLDLGSGAGFDAFLAARKVGPKGKVIGVDMTVAMVEKARANARRQGLSQAEFRLGEIEALPVADGTVDAIISNCVINLSPDKAKVFAEAFRVLHPGGRLAISDVVAFVDLPADVRLDLAAFTGCMAGAATPSQLEGFLKTAGFREVRIRPVAESRSFLKDWLPGQDISRYVVSASIEAVKPRP